MCRHNQLWGCCLLSFGVGLLVGAWLESSVLCVLLGIGLVFGGLCVAKR